MANPKLPWWYGLHMSGVIAPDAGTVIYVDGSNGSNANDGLTPDTPLLTVTAAITAATTNNDDYIVVLRYPSAGAAGETWPIAVNKNALHIVGGSYFPNAVKIIKPTGDTAAMLVTGESVEIAGLEFGGGATHGCIESASSGYTWRLHIHHCDIGWIYAAQDGIRLAGTCDAAHCHVHHNRFNDKLTRDGIRIEHNATRGVFHDNVVRLVGGIGIHPQGLCTDIYAIYDNVFRVADSANGEAITFTNANSEMCMVWGNQTMEGTAAMTQTPYRDLGSNHWGLNYYDIRAIMPVTV